MSNNDAIPAHVKKFQKAKIKAIKKNRRREAAAAKQRLKPEEITNRQKHTFGTMVANSQAKRNRRNNVGLA